MASARAVGGEKRTLVKPIISCLARDTNTSRTIPVPGMIFAMKTPHTTARAAATRNYAGKSSGKSRSSSRKSNQARSISTTRTKANSTLKHSPSSGTSVARPAAKSGLMTPLRKPMAVLVPLQMAMMFSARREPRSRKKTTMHQKTARYFWLRPAMVPGTIVQMNGARWRSCGSIFHVA